MQKADQLVALCFELRNITHAAHLSTSSFSSHKALEDFYTGIIPLADSFAESWQGRTGELLARDAVWKLSSDPDKIVSVLERARSWIDSNRSEVSTFPEIQNSIDEIVALFNTTLYKLRMLK